MPDSIRGGVTMRQYQMPVCKQQKQFEDLVQTLLKTAAQLSDDRQSLLLEYAMKLAYEERQEEV